MKPYKLLLFLFICYWLIYFFDCTENPFGGEDKISGNSIRGKIQLENNSNPGNVYIWLEVLNISARSQINGSFELSIPPPSLQPGGGIDGIYILYFYMANYQLYSLNVTFSNGNLLFPGEIFHNNGELKATIILSEILNIKTLFKKKVSEGNQDTLLAYFTVRAKSKQVVFTSYVSNPLLHNEPECLVGFLVDENERYLKNLERENRSHRMVNWKLKNQTITLPPVLIPADSLSQGRYKVIPYLKILCETLPSGLLESLNIRQYNDYLKIPLKINDNEFQILN